MDKKRISVDSAKFVGEGSNRKVESLVIRFDNHFLTFYFDPLRVLYHDVQGRTLLPGETIASMIGGRETYQLLIRRAFGEKRRLEGGGEILPKPKTDPLVRRQHVDQMLKTLRRRKDA